MTELAFGLGALPETPDPRDYQVAELYAATGTPMAAVVALPAVFDVPAAPSVYNQGTSPRCVTYSCAAEKAHQDRLDQGAFFAPDFPLFASQIGTTAEGASMRTALDRLVNFGMPEAGGINAKLHRIASYYSVPVTVADLKAAIHDFGGVLVIGPWANEWMHPGSSGILGPFDYEIGWHATWLDGWNDSIGGGSFTGRNSWGATWADHGNYHLPYSRLGSYVKFAWKTSDVLEWVKRTAACTGGYYRATASSSGKALGPIKAGDVVMARAGQAKAGTAWAFTCNGAKKGTGWWPIRAINGHTCQTLFGVPLVYGATGRFT